MDYFPKGTLLTVLSKYREKKEVIDEEVENISLVTFSCVN
jgi:hypothetical protein